MKTVVFIVLALAAITLKASAQFGYQKGEEDSLGNCVGSGLCHFVYGSNAGVPAIPFFSEGSTFGIRVKNETVVQNINDFSENRFVVNADQVLSEGILRLVGQSGLNLYTIKKGRYPITWNSFGDAIILFPEHCNCHTDTLIADTATNDFVFGPEQNPTEGYRYTVLGRQYGPVFNIDNVRNAWTDLTGDSVAITPSHYYVRFVPQNGDELKVLAEAKLATYTFPLDHEVLVPGDYMQDPAWEPNGIPPLYTCIPADVPIPNVTHEVLDELYILDMRSVVAQKAFELAGELDAYPRPDSGEVIPNQFLITTNGIVPHLCTYLDWHGRVPVDSVPAFPLLPPVDSVANLINTAPSTVINACSCNFNTDDSKPSGCIKVEETQWYNGVVRFEGVNDIVADFIGPFFQRLSSMTNEKGCYKDVRKMYYKVPRPWPLNPVKLTVVMSASFVSTKKTIKGLNHANLIEYALPMTHMLWSVQSGGLNHVNITYRRDWHKDNNEAKYYAGATANNAIYDFDSYANQDGIMPTMNNLHVLVHKYHGSGSAPMFHKLLASLSIPAITVGAFVSAASGALPVVGFPSIGPLIVAFPPDVTLGYKYYPDMENYTTDKLKETAYHEYAHVIHYRKTGNFLWENNIAYVALYGTSNHPYGNAGDPGSTRTDLIEMWGYYLGREYAHRRYGPNKHSILESPDPFNPTLIPFGAPVFNNSWYAVNEKDKFQEGHIPGGFLHDIRDFNSYNSANGLTELSPVDDGIRGFSHATIYNLLGSSTTTAAQLINALGGLLPSGNTTGSYNNLKASYGY